MSRPLIIEPDIIMKFRNERQREFSCIKCNHCPMTIESGPLRCWRGKLPKSSRI
jgi:2,4-dienoyl-CoA reductase-like NADH-dependent reductase (Old Yellow Enzyme family)